MTGFLICALTLSVVIILQLFIVMYFAYRLKSKKDTYTAIPCPLSQDDNIVNTYVVAETPSDYPNAAPCLP